MNPYTPLPSFYEMMLIEEAQRSTYKAIRDGLQSLGHNAMRQRTQARSIFGKIQNRLLILVEYLVRKYGPEVQLLITYLIERRCIMASSATLAESIYGGKRSKVQDGHKLTAPTRQDCTRLTLALTLGRYVDEKMENVFQKWRQTATRSRRLKDFFVKVYPYLRMTQQGTILAYQFLYLAGKTVYFHPSSHLLGLVVRRTTQADVTTTEPGASSKSNRHQELLQKWAPHLRKTAFWTVSTTLVLGWFYQLQQYIQKQESEQQATNLIPPAPAAPPLKLDPSQRIRVPETGDVCALCQQPWIAPSASPAGYVFCHKCLVIYVREHGKCPMTGATCSEKDIVRIYEPQASAA